MDNYVENETPGENIHKEVAMIDNESAGELQYDEMTHKTYISWSSMS